MSPPLGVLVPLELLRLQLSAFAHFGHGLIILYQVPIKILLSFMPAPVLEPPQDEAPLLLSLFGLVWFHNAQLLRSL